MKSVALTSRSFASAGEFLVEYDPDCPGCLVLDIRMPGMSGMELQQKLIEMRAILPIIFITGHGDIPMAVEAMQRGAIDFIPKPFRDHELLDRINKAHLLAPVSLGDWATKCWKATLFRLFKRPSRHCMLFRAGQINF